MVAAAVAFAFAAVAGVGVVMWFDNLLFFLDISTHIISRETCEMKRKHTIVVGANPERRRRRRTVQWLP
jgi:hypothetical protein